MTEHARRHGVARRTRLGIPASGRPNRLRSLALRVLQALARLHRIREEARGLDDPVAVAEYALRGLKVDVRLSATDVSRILQGGGGRAA
jgi:hypothetical protein